MYNKPVRIAFLVFSILTLGNVKSSYCQNTPANTPALSSQYATVSQRVGITEIAISYSRPIVRGREIWGSLVPYGYKSFSIIRRKPDAPWRTGANHVTTISFEHDVKINGQDLKAGKYGLSMAIFENNEVDIIFNKNTNSWGTFGYQPEDDVLKIKVQSEKTTEFKEAMAFEFFNGTTESAEIALLWENKKIPFKVDIETKKIVFEGLIREQAAFKSLSTGRFWQIGAAIYLMNSNHELEQAKVWMTQVIGTPERPSSIYRTFPNLTTMANLLLMTDQPEEATTLLDEAFNLPSEKIGAGTMNFYGRQALTVGKGFPDVSIRAYKFLEENYEDREWSAKNGLANAYSAKGDFKTALKHLKSAKMFAPKNYNVEAYESKLEKLKNRQDIN